MITVTRVEQLLNEKLQGTDLYPVEILVKKGNQISVFLDSDTSVTIEVCRNLNHFLEEALDREKEDFDLTVSSAGADRPLRLPRQFRKNLGRELEIVLTGGGRITGKVISADDSGVTLEESASGRRRGLVVEKKRTYFSFNDIKTAKEVITFKK